MQCLLAAHDLAIATSDTTGIVKLDGLPFLHLDASGFTVLFAEATLDALVLIHTHFEVGELGDITKHGANGADSVAVGASMHESERQKNDCCENGYNTENEWVVMWFHMVEEEIVVGF